MEIRNAVLLQGVTVDIEQRRKLDDDLSAIQRGSWYRLVGKLSLADVYQYPTLVFALKQFGNVDLVLVETYNVIRSHFGLFDDFIDFEIPLSFIDDIMEEIRCVNEGAPQDSSLSTILEINTEEIYCLSSIGRYKLKQALRGYAASHQNVIKSTNEKSAIYQKMVEIVRSGEAANLQGIAWLLMKRGYYTKNKKGEPTAYQEARLLRIADDLGKREEFRELRKSLRAKQRLASHRGR